MKNSKILFAVCVFIITAGFTACKKNNDAKPVCRINLFTLGGQVYTISYNSNGKVISLTTNSGFSQTYAYSATTTVITSSNSGAFSSKATVTLNAAGLATNVRTELNSSGTEWMNDAYEYNGEELIKQTSTRSSDNTQNITTYTWFNHNPISQTAGSSTETLGYYADKPRQNGDYLDFFQLIGGYEFLRTKNLLKTFGNSTLTYDFGTDGNIAALAITSPGGAPSTINYQYECN